MFLAVAVALAMAVKVSAGETTGASPFLGVLTTATSVELPAKAAELVLQADAKNIKQTTIDVVKAAVGLNPAAAPAIVGSIAKSSPAMAATASATAVVLVPSEVVAIARAAAAAAPAMAGSIVEAMCKVLPADYQNVADAVAAVVPGASKEILAGIVAAIPELKNVISQTLASYNGQIPSVSIVLQAVQNGGLASTPTALGSDTPSFVRGPSSGAPLTPISGTLVVHAPGSGSPAPPGGHNYPSP